jgi:hypothetical protein
MRRFLSDALSSSNDNARGFAFEHFGAYLLGLAFKSLTRLSDVFNFVIPSSLQDEKAVLVALKKLDDGTFQSFPVDISSDSLPFYILGRSPRTEMETLAWFKDPELNVFCFPVKTVGPDLIAFVELADGRRVPIIIQFKNLIQNTLVPRTTADGFRTTYPRQFISQRSGKDPPSEQASAAEDPPRTKKNKKTCGLNLFLNHLLTYKPLAIGGHRRVFMFRILS